ncbi:uncharacterized protein si:ch211-191i18.4 isoform X4 [Mugil cephalus]|uniref:uncharacterized protein si:ch211-191i18.4 isoform X4 n=1 Tax=Mugil cephalus TaxID=48193 RepID=UPI001FB6BEF9|nr:uncharacterized protein si:ch211-191i18.4 isoform X4 [Mugil cephalus]
MEVRAWVAVLLLISFISLEIMECSLPDLPPPPPPPPPEAGLQEASLQSPLEENVAARLPGLCRRLKRRRVTVLCNLEKFCWGRSRGRGHRSQGRGQQSLSGQVCRCPRGSRCSHFFVHSL